MFADDLRLVEKLVKAYGPALQPIVDVGGLEEPTIADYQFTIDAMEAARKATHTPYIQEVASEAVRKAQFCRYLNVRRPLSFLGDYIIENPQTGGPGVEDLSEKYPRGIGTAILLSVLEHVANPFIAVDRLYGAMKPGGLVIVSVPWMFPHHPSPRDLWRFAPDALRELFADESTWDILECDWRLKIPADAGVLDIRTMRPQAIESCYVAARAK